MFGWYAFPGRFSPPSDGTRKYRLQIIVAHRKIRALYSPRRFLPIFRYCSRLPPRCVRDRGDAILQFVLADCRGRESERLRQYAPRVRVRGGAIMTRVLVPVAVLKRESVSPGLKTLLGTVDVTVLGYHVLPDQIPPDQARLQYEDRAKDALEDLSEEFRTAGGEAEHRLAFTHDREQTRDIDSRLFSPDFRHFIVY